ncbi:hypothetical protein AB0G54_15685 [Streptomyces yokosukanensis]|uniref:hypothetical protein n=1 Tax=Streptomyces yokosukanensis TaxID=67386 RepID=UPI00343A6BF1
MSPIRAQSDPEDGSSGVRRGRHRKPRPRKTLLAAGGLALAAGALTLLRVTPDPGVGSPGTAEAEPHVGTADGATDHATGTTTTKAPGAAPSAISVLGGRSPAPTPASPAATTPSPPAPASGRTLPTGPTATPGTPRPPSAPPSTPHPAPTTAHPAPTTPTPTRSAPTHAPDGWCVPALGLCVDLSDDH